MVCRLLTTWMLTVAAARAAPVAGPSQLYVVSTFFSDNGALFYYRVIDVRPEGTGSLVRYIRVAPANTYCPRTIVVQAATATLPNKPPAEIVGTNNPCAVTPTDLHSALRKYKRTIGVFESISFGIVARCGSSPVTLSLPMSQRVDLDKMKRDRPDVAGLWDLASRITAPLFGEKDIFHDRTEQDDLALQQAGKELLPELTSGKYDPGLKAAVNGNVGTWHSPNFRSLLSGYRGPVSVTVTPRLINAKAYKFDVYAAAKYPPLALQALVQGKVELELSVRPATGEVYNVTVLSGHPLLTLSAVAAANQWRFAPDSVGAGKVKLTLDYSLPCP